MYERLCAKVLPELIPLKTRLLVAVSGGPDSVALAHVLWRFAKDYPERELELVLTHVHHGVRQESDGEEQLVRMLARQWGLKCIVHRFDARAYARETGRSFEDGARAWRYARWREDQREQKCRYIATAHHLGDQAETVLYRLIRGSGTAGLAGIYPLKDGIIRPFLSVTKREIMDYCRREELPYALDPSNRETIYARNRIRLELLPELEREYNPKVMFALGRTAELMRWDEEFIAAQAEKCWKRHCLRQEPRLVCLDAEIFHEPRAILSRLIRRAISYVSEEPRGAGYNYIENIMENGGAENWSQDLPGLRVWTAKGGLWFGLRRERVPSFRFEKNLRLGDWVFVPELGLKVGLFAAGSARPEANGAGESEIYWDRAEIERLPSPLVLRNRRPGDKLWFRKVGHKEFKKVCQEARIPAEKRERIPMIAAGNDVLWAAGIGISDLCAPHEKSALLKCIVQTEISGLPVSL